MTSFLLARRTLTASLFLTLAACAAPLEVPTSQRPDPTTSGSPDPSPTDPPPATTPPIDRTGPIDLEVVASGLEQPLDIAVHPRDPSAILVAEQTGRVRIVRDGAVVDRPFLDLSDEVANGGEQGLLGIAPHPDPDDDRVVVYYTDADDASQVVSTFRLDPDDPDRLRPGSEDVILRMADELSNHNGGSVAFGPDGYLYVGTGDGGGADDPLGAGQDRDTLLAKVLRVDIDVPADADRAYSIPAGNPFATGGGRPEIWATGLRNPWRMRFDPGTGDLWIGDVGQGEWEEIDRIPAGDGGLDFGWSAMEGPDCFAGASCDPAAFVAPVIAYQHDQGCSVTGGAVYRGAGQPGLLGRYVYADYCSGRFWTLDADATAPGEPITVLDSGRNISAIAAGPNGELFATDLGAGELLRVVAAD